MINKISENMVRTATKVDPGDLIHDREITQQKADEIRQDRPVENAEPGVKSENKNSEDKDSSRYLQDEKTMVFEKYNKDGELILRIPPSHKPVDERA